MIFTTFWFFGFAALFFTFYYAVRPPKFRFAGMLLFCAVFHYHFAGPAGVLPIIILGTLTYLAGLSRQRWLIIPAMVLVVAALIFYKYTLFLAGELLKDFPGHLTFLQSLIDPSHPIVAPLAISFFSFEFIHYLMEVLHGGEPIRKFQDFTIFSIFWPSLVAGPIKRYQQFLPSVQRGLRVTRWSNLANGLMRFSIGCVKKILIADSLTAWIRDHENNVGGLSSLMRWYFLGALAFRIYFDFGGYSDMAIGFARMMGIKLPENFRWPYLATSIADFWHRWHISLSTWIRDYVYIPLGGNRHGVARRCLNGLLAFSLCGLWHGAAWNFVAWGVYHGVGLTLENLFRGRSRKAAQALNPQDPIPVEKADGWVQKIFFCVATNLFTWCGWLLFFYPVNKAWSIFLTLFNFQS